MLDAMTFVPTTVGTTAVGTMTVNSISFVPIQQLSQYDSCLNSICPNTRVVSISFVPIQQLAEIPFVSIQ